MEEGHGTRARAAGQGARSAAGRLCCRTIPDVCPRACPASFPPACAPSGGIAGRHAGNGPSYEAAGVGSSHGRILCERIEAVLCPITTAVQGQCSKRRPICRGVSEGSGVECPVRAEVKAQRTEPASHLGPRGANRRAPWALTRWAVAVCLCLQGTEGCLRGFASCGGACQRDLARLKTNSLIRRYNRHTNFGGLRCKRARKHG